VRRFAGAAGYIAQAMRARGDQFALVAGVRTALENLAAPDALIGRSDSKTPTRSSSSACCKAAVIAASRQLCGVVSVKFASAKFAEAPLVLRVVFNVKFSGVINFLNGFQWLERPASERPVVN
jgi:hypothetical protein